MTRPLLLDLYCGAGGAAVGYHRAGFEVVGVDINPQPRYPFTFIREDALEYAARYGRTFDAIHASPPCQRYSSCTCRAGRRDRWPDLVEPTRRTLRELGTPWTIENVPNSPLMPTVVLCGSMFGLQVKRHRLFECSLPVRQPDCRHEVWEGNRFSTNQNVARGRADYSRVVGVWGHTGLKGDTELWRKAMGIDWMTGGELSESIPPAYTEYVGGFLLAEVIRRRGLESAGK